MEDNLNSTCRAGVRQFQIQLNIESLFIAFPSFKSERLLQYGPKFPLSLISRKRVQTPNFLVSSQISTDHSRTLIRCPGQGADITGSDDWMRELDSGTHGSPLFRIGVVWSKDWLNFVMLAPPLIYPGYGCGG